MSPEINNLKEDIDELKGDVKANTELTRKGFETMNGRVKDVELWIAGQKAVQEISKGGQIDWNGLAKLAMKALGGAIAIGLVLVQLIKELILNGST